MSDDILSQDEIDALLGKSSNASKAESEEDTLDLAAIGDVLQAAAEKTATAFGIMMGEEGKAFARGTAKGRLREFFPALQGSFVWVEGAFEGGLDGVALWIVPLESALAMAALARGEDPSAPPVDDLTGFREVAVEMAGHLADAVAGALGTEFHIEAGEPIRTTWEAVETPPIPVGPDEEVVYSRHSVEVGAASFDLAFVLPGDVARALAQRLSESTQTAAPKRTKERSAIPQPAREAVFAPSRAGLRGRTNGGAQIASVQFEELGAPRQAPPTGNIDLLLDVPLEVTVELGRTRMQIREILELGKGSIVELEKVAGEPVDIYVNGKLIARGEVVTIDENFGVKITDIVSRRDRVSSLH